MKDKEKAEFRVALIKLGTVFQRTVDADVVEMYWRALRYLSIAAFQRACVTAVGSMQFFPKPVELRQMAGGSERPEYREVDGQPVYVCPICRDLGIEVQERKAADGRVLGAFARPCTCRSGKATEAAWEAPDDRGDVFADTARKNSERLRDLERPIR